MHCWSVGRGRRNIGSVQWALQRWLLLPSWLHVPHPYSMPARVLLPCWQRRSHNLPRLVLLPHCWSVQSRAVPLPFLLRWDWFDSTAQLQRLCLGYLLAYTIPLPLCLSMHHNQCQL